LSLPQSKFSAASIYISSVKIKVSKVSMKNFYFNSISLLIMLTVVIGCGGKEWPPTNKTTGTVTLDGQPLEGATVSFFPKGDFSPANGKTDSAGRFEMTTFNSNDGAMTGSFDVTVAKYPEVVVETSLEGTPWTEGMESDGDQTVDEGDGNSLPKKYDDRDKPLLTATVVKGDSNVVNFELTSK
jgi:hypothetical protein